MLNILKAILRQTVRDKLLWGGAIYILGAVLIQIIGDSSFLRETGSAAFCDLASFLTLLLPIAGGWVTARACGTDLRDKTANYEILFGKKRAAVYLGRFFAALIIMFAVTALVPVVYVGFLTIKNGWGGSFAFSNALLHLSMVFPFVFRMVCFYTALTWHTAVTDLMTLLDFSNTTGGFFDGEDITVVKAVLSGKTAIRMLCTSFGIGLCWLLGGYAFFRKHDIS